ncbi:hypothetical protein [Streptomyces antimycoticus]
MSYASHLLPPVLLAELLDRAGLAVTARLVQAPGEGVKRTGASFVARKPE